MWRCWTCASGSQPVSAAELKCAARSAGLMPEVACVMLTSFADDDALFASIMAGAAGYVLKQIRGGELVEAIRRVARGESLLDPAVTARVLDRLRNPKPAEDDPLADLSTQELRILDPIAEGLNKRQIG